MNQTLRKVAIVGSARIPFCRSNTLYADLSNLDMLTTTLNGLVATYKLSGSHIDAVIGGAVVDGGLHVRGQPALVILERRRHQPAIVSRDRHAGRRVSERRPG